MKKSLVLVASLVLVVSMMHWSQISDPRAQRETSVAVSTSSSNELDPVHELAPAAADDDGRVVAPGIIGSDRIGDVERTATLDWVVRGRVVFSDGATGELPIVQLRLTLHEGYTAGDPFESTVVESNAEGTITWPLRDPGRTVTIRAELLDVAGYSARVQDEYLAVAGEGPVESIRVRVNPRDAWVEGIVRASAEAADPGVPIEGARIVFNEANTTSDARGAYRMAVPSRGYGALIATAEGFHRGGATPGGLSSEKTTVIDIVLDPELGREGTVFGHVRDARGAVLPDARVRCSSAREETVRTDATGYYELHDIELHPDGGIRVVAIHDAKASQEKHVRAPADGVLPAEGTELDFELVAGSRIEGTVVDHFGTPVRGASVWIGPHAALVANRRVHSDDDGAFLFENATPGKTLIGVRKVGQPGHVEDLRVPEDGSAVRVAIMLPRASPLRGRVVDETGAPVDRAVVQTQMGEYGRSIRQAGTTDASGHFEIVGVPEGSLEVSAYRAGVIRTTVTHVHEGEELELVVERATRIIGRVVDAATGSPIESFLVRLAPPEDKSLGPWFNGIDASWFFGGRSFNAVDGRWTTDEKDPIRAGAWTYVEIEAEGYQVLRVGPVQVAAAGPAEEWFYELVRH